MVRNVSLQQTLANGAFRWGVFLEDDGDFETWQPRSYLYGHNGTFMGANISWKPTPHWTLGGGINNIIAEDSTNYSIFYTAPRNVGTPQYRQDQTFESRRQFFVSARVDF
jgi:outer membrane receptor protein involved in Fe transport